MITFLHRARDVWILFFLTLITEIINNYILYLLCKRLRNQKEGKYFSTALYSCTSPLSCIIEKASASSSSSIQINMQQHGHNLWSFGFMVEFMKIRLHEQAAQTNKVARTASPEHLQESRCQSCHLCVSPTSNVCDRSLIKERLGNFWLDLCCKCCLVGNSRTENTGEQDLAVFLHNVP